MIWERAAAGSDGMGGKRRTWSRVRELLAEVTPTGGREALSEIGGAGVQGWRVIIRWRPDAPTHSDRLAWGAKVLNLRSDFADPDGTRQRLVAFAESGVVT